jgi:F-type H+-transporting ATPase subunit b
MRAAVLAIALVFAVFAQHEAEAPRPPDPAQHAGSEGTQHHGEHNAPGGEHHDSSETYWKIANFAILIGALGYLLRKNAGPFFRSRTAEIQKGIAEAAEMKRGAEARAAEIEHKMANLAAEIEAIRTGALAELAHERERISTETSQQLGKVQADMEHDLRAAVKASKQQLRAYSAELAVELAEARIAGRMTPEMDNALMAALLKDIGSRRNAPEAH